MRTQLFVRRARTSVAGALLLAAVSLGVTACGSGDSGSSSSSSGGADTTAAAAPPVKKGPALKGEPVKVMTSVPLNSELPTYPNIAAAAKLYAQWVNDNGGIAGRPLQVEVCDEKGDPKQAEFCARKAVADKVTAMVGSYGFTGDVIIPILKAADTAYFGECCPNSAAEFTSSNSFAVGNGPMYGPALAEHAVKDGHKNIGLVLIDGAQSYEEPISNALKALGTKLAKTVILPAKSQDYTPQVAQATSGTDALIMIVSEGPLIAWMPPFSQSGSQAQLYGPQGNLDPAVAKGFEDLLNGAVVGGAYPDLSLPVWKDFRAAIQQYKAPDLDYNTLAGLGEWAAFTAFRQIAEGIKGDINNKTFLDAASKANHVDTGGMTPVIDFTKPWVGGLKGYDRLFNRTAVFSKLENGKIVPESGEFKDYSDLALGKPPAQ